MARYDGSPVWRLIRLVVVGVLVAWSPLAVTAEPAGKPDPKAKPTPFPAAELIERLNALTEAQRRVASDLSDLREQLSTTQRSLSEGQNEVRQNREAEQTTLDQVKDMREEVRGLYVESSGIKGDIAQLGKQVEALDGSLGNFRLSSGLVVALVIVLQLILVGLMFRGRG